MTTSERGAEAQRLEARYAVSDSAACRALGLKGSTTCFILPQPIVDEPPRYLLVALAWIGEPMALSPAHSESLETLQVLLEALEVG